MKSFFVWIYVRLLALVFFLGAAIFLAVSGWNIFDAMEKIQRSYKATGTVVELVEKAPDPPKPAEAPKDKAGAKAEPDPLAFAGFDPTKKLDKSKPVEKADAKGADKSEAKDNEKAKEQKPSSCGALMAPVFAWKDAAGVEHRQRYHIATCPAGYKVGEAVELLVDPKDVKSVVVDSALSRFFGVWLEPAFYGSFVALLMLFGWFTKPDAARIAGLVEDPAHRSDDVPLGPDLAAGKPLGPLQGIVASAEDIEKGLYPLELCEFTAYMAALAYHEPGKNSPQKLEEYLKQRFRQMKHVKCFDRDETQGFAFLLDGAAFIIMRGTKGWADWSRNLDAWYAGPKDLLPPNAAWEVPGRHRGFAKGWHVVRQDIEDWIAETGILKLDPRYPFIFAGHSLGGALSFIGAREFAEQRRSVAAVITFGAARPGNKAFADRYAELGLDKRTLRLEFTEDIVPWIQQFVGYKPVGNAWIPKRLPLLSTGAAISSLPLNWMVYLLETSLFGNKEEETKSVREKHQKEKEEREKKKAEEEKDAQKPPKSFQEVVFWWAFRILLLVAASSLLALAAHKMEKRYALALSIMSYRRIRSRHMDYDPNGQPILGSIDYDGAYEELRRHLVDIRGAEPGDPGVFTSLKGLPRKVAGVHDIRFLNAFHPARSW